MSTNRENTNFLNAARKQRETFARDMRVVHDWNNLDVPLRVSIEDLLIMYDQLYDRMSQMDKVFVEAGIDVNLASR